ncbi:MAG: Rieske (2Fe-2S) protein [Candidatus Micrarchaeota archaeon]|nr:Rieske (2Fe-2S) protein [Candidatus Micrarchaeota archaeon]
MVRIHVGKSSELAPGSMKSVAVEGGDDIVVANVNGKFYAMRGICNHQGGPLAEGELEGNIITCPWHGSKWDVTTGKMTEFAIELDDEPVYKVIVEGEEVFVET